MVIEYENLHVRANEGLERRKQYSDTRLLVARWNADAEQGLRRGARATLRKERSPEHVDRGHQKKQGEHDCDAGEHRRHVRFIFREK